MSINQKFSSILFHQRSNLGYKQEYVAECCGLTTRQYQALEKGSSLPSFENALRLSIVLDFSLDSLKSEVKVVVLPLSRDK